MKQNDEIIQNLNAEIERRIEEMEKTNYQFPERFSRKDYIITTVVAVLCLLGIVFVGFKC